MPGKNIRVVMGALSTIEIELSFAGQFKLFIHLRDSRYNFNGKIC